MVPWITFNMSQILLAGATGYAGGHILRELLDRDLEVRVLVRSAEKLPGRVKGHSKLEIQEGRITEPSSLEGICEGIDTVISTVGITRQNEGFTYQDVDYQGNKNLLKEAEERSVRRFIYTSLLHGPELRHLKIAAAKEAFVEALQASSTDPCVLRPTGYFSDMKEFLEMAEKGRVYLFGKGRYRMNPIHGADLARVCADAIDGEESEIELGGPEVLTHEEIAEQAFEALGKEPRITYIPDLVRRSLLLLTRTFSGVRTYGPIEFFLTVMAMDMVAPNYGKERLADRFNAWVEEEKK